MAICLIWLCETHLDKLYEKTPHKGTIQKVGTNKYGSMGEYNGEWNTLQGMHTLLTYSIVAI